MKIILFKFIIIIFLISCAPGTEKPEPSAGDSLTQDTPKYFPDVVLVYENDPITIGSVDYIFSTSLKTNLELLDAVQVHEVTGADEFDKLVNLRIELSLNSDALVIGSGYVNSLLFDIARLEFPNVKFTLIDSELTGRNTRSILFRDQDLGFLAGVAAAYQSNYSVVSFIGGMDVPLTHSVGCGFSQGANYISDSTAVYYETVGETPAAWNDPERAQQMAEYHIGLGSRVLFPVAGGSSAGVHLAAQAQKEQVMTLGVDINQNGEFPGVVLTSITKAYEKVALEEIIRFQLGQWQSGTAYFGVREGAITYSRDENNASVLSENLIAELDNAIAKITDGSILVEDYMASLGCRSEAMHISTPYFLDEI